MKNRKISWLRLALALFLAVCFISPVSMGIVQSSPAVLTIVPDPGVPDIVLKHITTGGDLFSAMFKEKYGLNLEKTVRLIMTADRKGYEAAHVRYRGITPEQATRLRSNGMSIKNNTILLNGASDRFRSEQRIVLLVAHELFHKMQVQLAEGKGGARDYVWLREGGCNYFAAMVGEYGGLITVDQFVQEQLNTVKNTGITPALNRLLKHKGPDGWYKVRADGLHPYENATVMVKYLADNYGGHEKLLSYWKALAKVDRATAFSQTFGLSHDQFLAEFAKYYQKLLGGSIPVSVSETL